MLTNLEIQPSPINYRGTPHQIGIQHGQKLRCHILQNIDLLIRRDNVAKMLNTTNLYERWLERILEIVSNNWPWLIEEMKAIAEGSDVAYSDIIKLNFPVWSAASIVVDRRASEHECICFALRLQDGTVALASTLDDWHRYWSGPTHYIPEQGHRFISIGFPGTCWGGRGINSAGLCVASASQGLEAASVEQWLKDDAIPVGLALRIINQTCSKISEVRQFCDEHKFNAALICVDASGDTFCVHQTPVGSYEMPFNDFAVFANCITDDRVIYELYQQGYEYLNPEQATSRFRRGKVVGYAQSHLRKASLEQMSAFIVNRDDRDKGSVHNSGTVSITLANPQVNFSDMFFYEPNDPAFESGFRRLAV